MHSTGIAAKIFRKQQASYYRTLKDSPQLFDSLYYLCANLDVLQAKRDPITHYIHHGADEGRNPSANFNTNFYKSQMPVYMRWCNPLIHFIKSSSDAACSPMPSPDSITSHDSSVASQLAFKDYINLVDTEWYLDTYRDVAKKGMTPLGHFRLYGWKNGYKPNKYFDPRWYSEENLGSKLVTTDPLLHYCQIGWKRGLNPSPFFSIKDYYELNPDVQSAGSEPLSHFLFKKRNHIDTEYYTSINSEFDGESVDALKKHFIDNGHLEQRIINSPSQFRVASDIEKRTPRVPLKRVYGGRPQYSSPLLIAGFHRSGTSLTTNLFMNAGLYLGKELLGARVSNPNGHFEDVDIVRFHDRLLARSGSHWQTESDFLPVLNNDDWQWMTDYGIGNSEFPAWGFKDPRSCLFLSQWAEVFPDLRVLYIFRPAVECIHSIKRRAARDISLNIVPKINGRFWQIDDLAVRMYIAYASSFLRFAKSFDGDICVAELNDIIEGREIVSEVRDNWGYPLADAYIDDIYDSEFMSRAGPNELIKDTRLLAQVEEIETKIRALARRGFYSNKPPQTDLE